MTEILTSQYFVYPFGNLNHGFCVEMRNPFLCRSPRPVKNRLLFRIRQPSF